MLFGMIIEGYIEKECNSFENVSFYTKHKGISSNSSWLCAVFILFLALSSLPEHLGQADLELRDHSASASLVLGLQACAPSPGTNYS